jgi:hypothetical protein
MLILLHSNRRKPSVHLTDNADSEARKLIDLFIATSQVHKHQKQTSKNRLIGRKFGLMEYL